MADEQPEQVPEEPNEPETEAEPAAGEEPVGPDYLDPKPLDPTGR